MFIYSCHTNLHSHMGVPFSPHLATFVVCSFIDDSHSDRCEVITCGFNLRFSDD